jgi:hypothetical protein
MKTRFREKNIAYNGFWCGIQRTVVSTSGSTKLDNLAKITGRISFAKTCREDPDNPTRRAGAGEAATLKKQSTTQHTPIVYMHMVEVCCTFFVFDGRAAPACAFRTESSQSASVNQCIHRELLTQSLQLLYNYCDSYYIIIIINITSISN